MIRLPYNVDEVRGQNITLRFASTEECGYKMLFEAGSAKLAHRMISLDDEERNAEMRGAFGAGRSVEEIRASKEREIAALNGSRHVDGEGRHCLTLSVGDALTLVSPFEQIKRLSEKGVPVTGHNFPPAQVGAEAQQILERFEKSIQQVAEAANQQVAVPNHQIAEAPNQQDAEVANTEELGMFMQGPSYNQ